MADTHAGHRHDGGSHDHAHDHAHGHHHGHSHGPPANNAAFAVGIALNAGFVVAEFAYGLAANSLALLSDAGHNLSDVFALLIAWGALHLGRTAPTRRRTYGLRRTSILAALVNAVVLLVVVGAITWEALLRFGSPVPVAAGTVIVVAAAGILVNAISAMMFMAGRKHDLNVRGAFLHMVGDAAISAGVVVAGLAIRATGWQWLDPLVSIAIGALIVWGTWGLLRESLNLTLDAVPEGIDTHAVESYLAALPGVHSLHDLHIWGMSTTESALTVHLVMPQPPGSDLFIEACCRGLREDFRIGHVTIQIEHGDEACRQETPCRPAP
ncbi:MAG TPA: cation diffusion facilitator family transporter [Usitatibacter sp.]|nr:cation diffusion facilitator family transporter [Usitatibacter sp.]